MARLETAHRKGGRLPCQAWGPDWETFSFPIDFECRPCSESPTPEKSPPPNKTFVSLLLSLMEKEGATGFVSGVAEDKCLHLGANQTIN